jgi:hypothetical protein
VDERRLDHFARWKNRASGQQSRWKILVDGDVVEEGRLMMMEGEREAAGKRGSIRY